MTVLEKEIRRQLHEAGLDLNPEEMRYSDVVEYLEMANSEKDLSEDKYYSIHDWIRDTVILYPENLLRFYKYGR